MARAPKQTPTRGVGDNSGLPAHDDLRTAAAMEMIFEEKEKKLRDEKKRARLRLVEGKHISQDDLKFLKDLRGKPASDVIERFKRQWHVVGAFYPEQHEQLDFFVKRSDAPTRAAYYTMGLVAGLEGKELQPPPMVVDDDLQQMTKGHNEGMAKYRAAWEALAASNGSVVDGTGKAAAGDAEKVADKAAKDFAADNGEDPLVVNGERYKSMRQANAARARLAAENNAASTPSADAPSDGEEADEEPIWQDWPDDNLSWTEEQKAAFAGWFMEAADGVVLDADDFEHAGAAAEVRRLQQPDPEPSAAQGGYLGDAGPVVGDDFQPPASAEASPPAPEPKEEPVPQAPRRAVVARPDFHSWDDDWQKWTGPQTMEFRRWFESLPPGTIPAITHTGAVDFFNLLREEVENRTISGEDDDAFEMSESERAAQQGRPVRQEAETPDPAEVEAAARKLQESGFAAPPKTRSRRKPV